MIFRRSCRVCYTCVYIIPKLRNFDDGQCTQKYDNNIANHCSSVTTSVYCTQIPTCSARMTEDKNLTPFSIADILKSDDRVGRDGDGDAAAAAPAARRTKNCADGALDMTNNKCVVKKGKSILYNDISSYSTSIIYV